MSDKDKSQLDFWLRVLKVNASNPIIEFSRSWRLGSFDIKFSYRSRNNVWGRFGAGWNWKLGFSAGGRCCTLHLLIADLRIYYKKV
jgi:hypothetical protein